SGFTDLADEERVQRGEPRGEFSARLEIEGGEQLEEDRGCLLDALCLALDVALGDLPARSAQVCDQALVQQHDELLARAAENLCLEVSRCTRISIHAPPSGHGFGVTGAAPRTARAAP